jgi:hypothetical protein
VKDYKDAIVKFNAGNGALLCNGCEIVIATGFEHEDREHFCAKCVLKQTQLDSEGKPSAPVEKPHRGRIAAWRKTGHDKATAYEGVFLDHPNLTGFMSVTSAVVTGPDGGGEIETRNSHYTLIGAETTGETLRTAQHLYDSLPVLQADEGLAYAITEQSDLSGAVAALMSVVDRTLADVERTVWERRVAAALLFESNWSTMRELAQRLRNRLLGLPRGKIEIHKQIEAICDAMQLLIAPRRDEHDVSTAVTAARAVHKSANWAVGHGEAKLDRAQIITAAWYMRASGALDAIDREEELDDDDCFGTVRRIAEGLHRTIGGRERKREEREQTKPEGTIVMTGIGGAAIEKQKEIANAYKKLIGVRLPVVRAGELSAVRERLAGEFPHAAEQIGVLLSDLVEGDEIRFRLPTLIVGKPGGGKSRLVRRLCAELKLPLLRYDAAGSGDNAFAGTPRRWHSGEHCTPLEAVHRSLKSNPAVLIDEIDKCASSRHNGNLETSLMPFLEVETSARYPDPFIESDVDLSHVNFLLTANDDSKLQGPLRDRLRIVRMPEPRREDLPTLARAMVSDMARERGGNPAWWPHLNEDELEIAGRLWLGGSVRRLRFIVERLLAAREKNARN